MQSNGSILEGIAFQDKFPEKFVDVLIHRLDTDTFVAKYSIPLINEREVSSLKSWLNEAWSRATADGLVADQERSEHRLELQGNLTVNEAIDRAQELNGLNVCVRGLLVLDFEHEALKHQPISEYWEWLPPSNTTGHHRLFGSEIWLNQSTLGLTRLELSPCIGVWVSVFGTLHAVNPPHMKNRWQSRLLNWWKYGSAEPYVGLGHWGGFPVAIDVLEITDLQPLTANQSEQVDAPSVEAKEKVIRGTNVTERIIRPRKSGQSDDCTAPRTVQHNDDKPVKNSMKLWLQKVQSPGKLSWIWWCFIALFFINIIGKFVLKK
jgi:hypothetical protein